MGNKSGTRARRRAAAAEAWSKEAALKRLGPCPALPKYCEVDRDSANPREDARWIAKQRDCRAIIRRRKEWLRKRDEIEERDRRHRAVMAAPGTEDLTVRDPASRVEVSPFGVATAPKERAGQGLGLHLDEIADPTPSNRSRKRTVTRATDTLDLMLRNGTIGRGYRKAGRKFQNDFGKAQLDRIAIASLLRVGGRGRGGGTIDDARADIGAALRALGGEASETASVVWYVVGQGHSIREWCQRITLGHGKAMNPHVAKGLLIAGLGVLHRHYYGPAGRARSGEREAA